MNDEYDLNQRIMRLEERLAQEERLVEQLNEIVTKMHLDFVRLEKAHSSQAIEIRDFIQNHTSPDQSDEKPPHY